MMEEQTRMMERQVAREVRALVSPRVTENKMVLWNESLCYPKIHM